MRDNRLDKLTNGTAVTLKDIRASARATRAPSLLDALEGILKLLEQPCKADGRVGPPDRDLSTASARLLIFAREDGRSDEDKILLARLACQAWEAANGGRPNARQEASFTIGEVARRLRSRGRLQ